MKYYYLTDAEIKNLKKELMTKKSKTSPQSKTKSNKNSLSKTFSSLYKQSKNSESGHYFEENIKNILKIEYGWTDELKDTHFFYRIIQVGNKKILIKLGYSKKLIINGRKYKFVFYPNKSISIFRGYILRRFITNISEKTQETKITLNDTKIIISKVKEIEIDGFFKLISNNIKKIINDEDVICLYKSINNNKINNIKYACCEIKLSFGQIFKLIEQLKKDKNVLENIIGYKHLVYIGFVGYGKIRNNLLNKLKKIEDLDFFILKIKNCYWFKRKLTQNIDWEAYSLLKNLKSQNDLLINDNAVLHEDNAALHEDNAALHEDNAVLHNENALLKKKFDILNKKYNTLSELVKNALNIKSDKLISKKRGKKKDH